jgi:hypothetical protein
LGYGNASGFLASANLLIPPPESEDASIDPISGARERQSPSSPRPRAEEDEMTEEEKEREAEKLFTLFERLQKTGVVKVQNPITEAQQSGRFEEIKDGQNDRADKEDEEERQALEEMRRYKERKAGHSQK